MYNTYRFKMYAFVLCLICNFIISCSTGYPDIKPLSVQQGEIAFEGVNKDQIKTTFVCSVPESYNPHQSWPLLIALHGSGSNAVAFLDVFKTVTDTLGLVLVALQGERKTENGFGWQWDINSERSLLSCLDIIQKQIPIDTRKIFLLGFSSGGRIAFELGIKNSRLFKGIILLSAPFDSTHISITDRSIRHMRFFVAHGEYEQQNRLETQFLVNLLTSHCEAVEYRIFENTGHGLPDSKAEVITQIVNFLLTPP
jgi:predicted esterase